MDKFLTWLEERSAFWAEESRRLAADGRSDEGNLAKVRMNVYGICKSVFQVQDAERALDIMNGLRGEWETSLATARAHDDVKKVVVEEMKLEALTEIQGKLNEV